MTRPRRRRVKQPEQRQAEIIEAAFALFMRQGFTETSIQQIINEIGIAKGTFYHHFPSKSALLEAMLDGLIAQGIAIAQTIVSDPELPALEKLNTLFSSLGSWKSGQRDALMPMLRAMRLPQNAALYSGIVKRQRAAFVPMMARLIAEGVQQGAFDVLDPDLTAGWLFSIQVTTGELLSELLLGEVGPDTLAKARQLVTAQDQAVTRLLATPPGSFHMTDEETLSIWFS